MMLDSFFFKQGQDEYLKRVNAFCYDRAGCRPRVMRPLEWYCATLRHLVAGFANILRTRRACNCDFVTVGDHVFLKARRNLGEGGELCVFYKFPRKSKKS